MTIPIITTFTGELADRNNAVTFPVLAQPQFNYITTVPEQINTTVTAINAATAQVTADKNTVATNTALTLGYKNAAEAAKTAAEAAQVSLTYSVGFAPLGAFASGIVIDSAQKALWYDGELLAATTVIPANFPFTTDGATPTLDSRDWTNVTLEAKKTVARSLNVLDSDVMYANDTATPITKYIYDTLAQKTWAVPAAAIGKIIVSVVGDGLLVQGGETYTLLTTTNAGQGEFDELKRQGIWGWDIATTYPVHGCAKGSNGVIYQALTEQAGNNPITDSGTNWLPVASVDNVSYQLAMRDRTWQDVTSSRVLGVVYTNTNSYEIQAFLQLGSSGSGIVAARVDVGQSAFFGPLWSGIAQGVASVNIVDVPAGETYTYISNYNNGTLSLIMELS